MCEYSFDVPVIDGEYDWGARKKEAERFATTDTLMAWF